jgi:hypothetical protein
MPCQAPRETNPKANSRPNYLYTKPCIRNPSIPPTTVGLFCLYILEAGPQCSEVKCAGHGWVTPSGAVSERPNRRILVALDAPATHLLPRMQLMLARSVQRSIWPPRNSPAHGAQNTCPTSLDSTHSSPFSGMSGQKHPEVVRGNLKYQSGSDNVYPWGGVRLMPMLLTN